MAENPQAEAKKDQPAPAAPAPAESATPAVPAAADAAKAEGGDEKSAAKQALSAKIGKVKDLLKGAKGSLFVVPKALWRVVRGILSAPLLLFKGDLVEKILSIGFFSSVILAGYTSVHIYKYLVHKYQLEHPVAKVIDKKKDYLSEQKELAKLAANLFMLEKFSAGLESAADLIADLRQATESAFH